MMEAPLPEVVTKLLRQRWALPKSDELELAFSARGAELSLRSGSSLVTFRIDDQGENAPDWEAVINALDALVGQFEESGRDHRSMPTGSGVAFEGRPFRVAVEKDVPELSQLADTLLSGRGS